MANEISYSSLLSYVNALQNIASLSFGSGTKSASIVTQPGNFERTVITVTDTKTAIPTPLIGTLGLSGLHNCDAANSVFVYANTSDTTPLLEIKPGEWSGPLRFAQAAVPAVATTASSGLTALLEYFVLDN